MHLLIGHYDEPNPERATEYAECLKRNCANPHIESVTVFCEDDSHPLKWPKVWQVAAGCRMRYKDFFEYASVVAAATGSEICIVANADIYFDDSLAELEHYDFRNKLLCLSRWDVQANGKATPYCKEWSHDAWIFRAPLRPFPCDWYLGKLACDTRLAFEAKAAGIDLLNPCWSIRANHLHQSGVHNYGDERIEGDELWIPPTRLDGTGPGPMPHEKKMTNPLVQMGIASRQKYWNKPDD